MADREPKAGHKYRSRKQVRGRWVYEYGDGAPKARQGARQEPPPGTVVLRPGQPPPQRTLPPLPAGVTHQDVVAAIDAAVARLRADKRRRELGADMRGDLSGLFPPDTPRSPPAEAPARVPPKTIKSPGTKADLMRQAAAIGKWTTATLLADQSRFSRETGFQLIATAPGKRPGPNRLKAAQGTATCLLAVRHLVNVVPEMAARLSIEVKAKKSRMFATYSSGVTRVQRDAFGRKNVLDHKARNLITVHDHDNGQSVLHEFGHYLDHCLGDPTRTRDFATARPGTLMREFVKKASETDSARSWREQGITQSATINGMKMQRQEFPGWAMRRFENRERRHYNYLTQPSEVMARFFDCWAHWKLGQRGFDTKLLGTKPNYKAGAYTDADIERLAPLFEKALGDHLAKSVLRALEDLAWLAKARGRPLLA